MSKYDFSKISTDQKKAIRKIESGVDELAYLIDEEVPPCPHIYKAFKYLKEAMRQCNAAILFNWNGNNA